MKPHIKLVNGMWRVVGGSAIEGLTHRAWRWCWSQNNRIRGGA